MSEIATIDDSSIDLLPAQRPPSVVARQMLMAHAEMMQTAYQLASKMVETTMVPKRFFKKPEDATAAILYGAELGLNPIQALQRVIPIHGMPSIESRTMVALLKARGYKIWTAEQSDTSVTVRGCDLAGDEYESTWTIDRAIQAGYVPIPSSDDSLRRPTVDADWVTVTKTWDGKPKVSVLGNMKYITDPQTMLKAKGQAEVCRDMAPDVLLGISYTSEELESERWDGTVSVEKPAAAAPPVTVDEILGTQDAKKRAPAKAAAAKAEAKQEPQDVETVDEPVSEPVEKVDTPPSESGPKPEPAQVTDPENEEPSGTDERAKITRKMFALLKKGDCTAKEERLVVYRSIADRADINSTNDLQPIELAKIVSTLDRLDRNGGLAAAINDALNLAALKEAEAAEAAANSATTEGNN